MMTLMMLWHCRNQEALIKILRMWKSRDTEPENGCLKISKSTTVLYLVNVPNTKKTTRRNQPRSPSHERDTDSDHAPGEVAADIAKIYCLLAEVSRAQNNKLDEIHRATTSMESKLTAITARLSDVESWLDFLEDSNKALKANPPLTRSDLQSLRQRVDDLESRSRRNNLVFVGFPESCEYSGTLSFLTTVIPDILRLNFPKGLELDRAHRALASRRPEGQSPRAIVARFLRYQDRDPVIQTAWGKGKLTWKGHHIMIFPDYSKAVNDKRRQFKRCKEMLHERRIGFSRCFLAVLVINPKGDGGRRREFDDPKKALQCIETHV